MTEPWADDPLLEPASSARESSRFDFVAELERRCGESEGSVYEGLEELEAELMETEDR